MTLKDLVEVASGLPVGAGETRGDIDRQCAALNTCTGKLSSTVARLADTGSAGDAGIRGKAIAHCDASLLVIASIAAVHRIDLEEAVTAGIRELMEG
jgi:hypothetical protein